MSVLTKVNLISGLSLHVSILRCSLELMNIKTNYGGGYSYMGLLDTVHHAVYGLGYVLCINISPILNFSLSYY